jgi:hypothetical protein
MNWGVLCPLMTNNTNLNGSLPYYDSNIQAIKYLQPSWFLI